jgi:serine/threonine-protein kinase
MPDPTPEGYRLLRTLGFGGDGWVALAVQESVGRQVAVKTLYATEPAALARFRREGQALAQLASDRIVRVYDLVEADGRVALILEYAPGGSLHERLVLAPALTIAERLAILADVAEALTCAHAAGIVHRDVKPANVLLDEGGRAKLADFGIARLTAASAAFRTQDGSITATRRYAAPEQLTDPSAEAPSIDAYAFGVLAREVLLGPDAVRLPEGLPTPLSRALDAAVGPDAEARPIPDTLAGLLLAAPATCWPAPAALPSTSDATGRSAGSPRTAGSLPSAAANVSARQDVAWVDPPVFVPVRRRSRWTGWLVGVLLGLALAAAIAVLL